jgi:hypothetical protein
VGSVCYQQCDQHPVQPVPDCSPLLSPLRFYEQLANRRPTDEQELIPTVTHLTRSMKDLLSLNVLLIGVVQLFLGLSTPAADDQTTAQPAAARIAEIERDLQGRLGVAILDTANGRSILIYRVPCRTPLSSTSTRTGPKAPPTRSAKIVTSKSPSRRRYWSIRQRRRALV